jgi:large subunit ribosomal protein L19e
MSVKLTRRIASELMKRGESKIRILPSKLEDAQKAITREDVRALIASGGVYAVKAKHNMSAYSKVLREKRNKGRRRGPGRRKGTANARMSLTYKKKIRGQRRVLGALKLDGTIDRPSFKKYYRLVKGGNFATKGSLLSHIAADGISITPERMEKLKHM